MSLSSRPCDLVDYHDLHLLSLRAARDHVTSGIPIKHLVIILRRQGPWVDVHFSANFTFYTTSVY